MLEEHLKTLSESYNFPFNHVDKSVNIDLDPPFSCQLMERNHLRFFAKLPPLPKDQRADIVLKLMQLNVALSATTGMNIGLIGEEHLTLSSDFHYELSYKMLVECVETFANHLDKLSAMIAEDHGKSS